jgi:DNA-binding transcriptional MerR regulator
MTMAGTSGGADRQATYAISDLAQSFAVTPRAIRFYESQGLLAPRRVGTMRIYSHRDRARLQLILRGKRLGFSLAEIKEWLDLYDHGDGRVRQLHVLLARSRERIRELERQLEDLTLTLQELRAIERTVAEQLAAGTPAAARP